VSADGPSLANGRPDVVIVKCSSASARLRIGRPGVRSSRWAISTMP